MADARQVKNAKVGLSHNLGLGGAVVVGLYTKLKPDVPGRARPDQTCDPDLLEQWEKQHETRAKSKWRRSKQTSRIYYIKQGVVERVEPVKFLVVAPRDHLY